MNFTDFVVYTGVEQNTFGSSSFTGVDVRTDTDVTVACDGCCTSHLIPRYFFRRSVKLSKTGDLPEAPVW